MENGEGGQAVSRPNHSLEEQDMETSILGKVAFITGAGYGVGCDPKKQGEHAPNMGAAIAQRLAKMGAVVVATDINAEAAAVTVSSLETYPGNPAHTSFKLDVTDKAEIEAVLAEVQKKYGRLDIVCCNAGVSSMAPFEKLSEKEWDFNVDVNMKGVFLCMQAVVPYLCRGG
ncbi:MAG: SDR family NAD(P)-dependent oxidoreductase, partial [Clostridia bacterium]|nr:SDR family NAD(P)-dependent oxidoreductase [Clostridia bacterium]